MRISDVVSQSGLVVYAEVALILFLAVFVVIVVRLFLPSRRRELDRAARLPLDDGASTGVRPDATQKETEP